LVARGSGVGPHLGDGGVGRRPGRHRVAVCVFLELRQDLAAAAQRPWILASPWHGQRGWLRAADRRVGEGLRVTLRSPFLHAGGTKLSYRDVQRMPKQGMWARRHGDGSGGVDGARRFPQETCASLLAGWI
jgi:hypothetical protein